MLKLLEWCQRSKKKKKYWFVFLQSAFGLLTQSIKVPACWPATSKAWKETDCCSLLREEEGWEGQCLADKTTVSQLSYFPLACCYIFKSLNKNHWQFPDWINHWRRTVGLWGSGSETESTGSRDDELPIPEETLESDQELRLHILGCNSFFGQWEPKCC